MDLLKSVLGGLAAAAQGNAPQAQTAGGVNLAALAPVLMELLGGKGAGAGAGGAGESTTKAEEKSNPAGAACSCSRRGSALASVRDAAGFLSDRRGDNSLSTAALLS